MRALVFEPLIAPMLWLALAVVATIGVGVYAWRRPRSLAMRRWWPVVGCLALGLAALLAILLNPTWVEPVPPPAGKPLLTVLVDATGSMGVRDLPGNQSRFAAACDAAAQIAAHPAASFDVEVRTFARTTTSVAPGDLPKMYPDGMSTDLTRAISESLEVDRPQGHALVLLSDGIQNAGGGIEPLFNAAGVAKAMNVPIWTKTFGGKTQLADLEISVPRPQELVFVGQPAALGVSVRRRGVLADRAVVVVSTDGKEVARREVKFDADGMARTSFEVQRPTTGLFTYDMKVEPVVGEATTANNTTRCVLRVVDQPIRILLLEGKPYWDTKFLLRTLVADGSVDVDAVIRLATGRFLRRTLRLSPRTNAKDPKASPSEVERTESATIIDDPQLMLHSAGGLDAYQVIVLGRDAETFLTDQVLDDLRGWISRSGGSLVCFRGSPVANVSQRLGRMMPVHWKPGRESRFRVHLTDRGQNLPWLSTSSEAESNVLPRLPSLATEATPGAPKPLAVVLADSEAEQNRPVVTYQSYGAGRVVVVEGAGMWRWAFLSPEHREEHAIYASLWQNLMRWLVAGVGLAPGHDLALRLDRVSFATDEPVTPVLLRREDAPARQIPAVELRSKNELAARRIVPVPLGDDPGVYQIVLGKLPEGEYRLEIVGDGKENKSTAKSIAFDVHPFFGEQLDVDARPDLMERIANTSGGKSVTEIDPTVVAQLFSEYLARARPPQFVRTTAWDRWWVLVGIIGVWGTAWVVRRRGGAL
jgi:hypothetical protein